MKVTLVLRSQIVLGILSCLVVFCASCKGDDETSNTGTDGAVASGTGGEPDPDSGGKGGSGGTDGKSGSGGEPGEDGGDLPPPACPDDATSIDELEPNDVRADAQVLTPCTTIEGSNAAATEDWFKVKVPEGVANLTVELTDSGEGTQFQLYKGDATEFIDYDVLGAKETSSLRTGVTAGEYFILVSPGSTYELTVKFDGALFELEESNDVRPTAQLIEDGETCQGGRSTAANDEDWFKVKVPEGAANLTVELKDTGEGTESGAQFQLYKGDATEFIDYDVLGAKETSSLRTGVTPGEYFILVTPGSTYELTVKFDDALFELEESNDARPAAQLIEDGKTCQGGRSTAANDEDWFKVKVPGGAANLTVELKDTGEGTESGAQFQLYKGEATEFIDYDVLGAKETSSLRTGVTAGEYFILVTPGSTYELTVKFGDELFELEESNDVRATAQLIEDGKTYQGGRSTAANDEDWFKLEVPGGTTSLTIDLTDAGSGATSGTDFVLYNEAEEQIDMGAPEASDTLHRETGVTGGDYFLLVRPASERSYTLKVAF